MFPRNIPDMGPKEAAHFPAGKDGLTYRAFHSSQKGVAYNRHSSFLLGGGSLEVWS